MYLMIQETDTLIHYRANKLISTAKKTRKVVSREQTLSKITDQYAHNTNYGRRRSERSSKKSHLLMQNISETTHIINDRQANLTSNRVPTHRKHQKLQPLASAREE